MRRGYGAAADLAATRPVVPHPCHEIMRGRSQPSPSGPVDGSPGEVVTFSGSTPPLPAWGSEDRARCGVALSAALLELYGVV